MIGRAIFLSAVVGLAALAHAKEVDFSTDWTAIALGTEKASVVAHFRDRILVDSITQFRVSATVFDHATNVDLLFQDGRVCTALVWFTNVGAPIDDRVQLYREIRERLPHVSDAAQTAARLKGHLLFGPAGLLGSASCEFAYQVFEGRIGYRLKLSGGDAATLDRTAEVGLFIFYEQPPLVDYDRPSRANQHLRAIIQAPD